MNQAEFLEVVKDFDWIEYNPKSGTIDFVFDRDRTLRWNELFFFFCLDWAGHYFVARGWDFKRLQLESRGFRFLMNQPAPCSEEDLDRLCRDIVDMLPFVESWHHLAGVFVNTNPPRDLENKDLTQTLKAQFTLPARNVLRQYLALYEDVTAPELAPLREEGYALR